MENKHCLNCETDLTGKFCSNCGQRSDTHRLTLKHLVFHDIIHGTFHFEKGMLFTAKQTLLNPGKAALDYISGKRVNYYNIFYFILLLIGINLFLGHYYEVLARSTFSEHFNEREFNETGVKLNQFLNTYNKIMILAVVPLFGIKSYLLFRRKKLNLTEHFILSSILLLGVALIYTLLNALSFLDFAFDLQNLKIHLVYFSFPIISLSYALYGYYNAFHKDYTVWGGILRLTVLLLLVLLELYTIMFFVSTLFV